MNTYDYVRMTAAKKAPMNADMKYGRRCALHTAFDSETCSRESDRKQSHRCVIVIDVSRLEQHALERFLIEEGEHNAGIYRRMVAVYGE